MVLKKKLFSPSLEMFLYFFHYEIYSTFIYMLKILFSTFPNKILLSGFADFNIPESIKLVSLI